MAKKTWQKKLEKASVAEIKIAPDKWTERYGGNKMLIPSAVELDGIVQQLPAGKLRTIGAIRDEMAAKHNADFSCPLVSGIFSRIVAEASEEDLATLKEDRTPWWRLVKDDGSLFPKFPGAGELQASYLKQEGFEIVKRGKKLFVMDFDQFLG